MFLNKKALMLLMTATIMVVGGITGCSNDKQQAATGKESVKQIGVLQLVQHGALDDSNKGFVDGLASRGYRAGDNLQIDQQNAQGDQSNLKTISQRFVNNKVDLIFAISTPAAQVVANETKSIPIVGAAIVDYTTAKLVVSNERPGGNVTGTTIYNPPARQVDLALKLLPNAKTAGVLYTSSELNAQLQVKAMKEYAAQKGIAIVEVTISNVNEIQQAAQSLVGKVDFIYCPTDNNIASAMANIAKVALPAKMPVIVGDETMVKTGGTAGISVNFYKLGFQAGEMAADILDGKSKPAEMPIGSQAEVKIIINSESVAALGLDLPADLLGQQ